MTCQELVELVTDYFDGAMDEATRAEFDAHLVVCPGCMTFIEQMRTTLRLTHDIKALEHRPEVIGLLGAFRDWREARPLPG
jgi:predicted anti-sigma-YlaC factor YlaD